MSYPDPHQPPTQQPDLYAHAAPQSLPPQQPYPQQVVMVQGPPTSGWAIASLIFGIIGALGGWCLFAVPCVVAVICGHAGLIDTKAGVRSGRGMAIAGLILGYLLVGPILVLTLTGGIGSFFDRSTP